jgi:hypothetical protein
MTTIIGDAKRKILVSDSQTSDDDSDTKAFNLPKVFKVPQGWLAGAGDMMSVQRVVEWFKDGKKGKPPVIKIENDADFMLLSNDGLFVSGKDLEFWEHTDVDAIGSGTAAALAVMSLGHTAEEACWAACQSDLYSGEPVKVYTLGSDHPVIWKPSNKDQH